MHRIMYLMSLRGMGVLNSENDRISGENWFQYYLKKKELKLIFDVGANTGQYASLLIKEHPSVKVYSFEPHPVSYGLLQKNVKNSNVIPINIGLGKEEKLLLLYDYKNDQGSQHASLNQEVFTQMYKKDIQTTEVKINTLDNFCRENDISEISFLKIDVEGLEFDVLLGAKEMIENGKVGIIQFEFNSNNVYTKTSMNDFQQFLKNYTLYRLMPDGLINLTEESYLVTEIYLFQNIVAIRNF